jgi:hypothetical protein
MQSPKSPSELPDQEEFKILMFEDVNIGQREVSVVSDTSRVVRRLSKDSSCTNSNDLEATTAPTYSISADVPLADNNMSEHQFKETVLVENAGVNEVNQAPETAKVNLPQANHTNQGLEPGAAQERENPVQHANDKLPGNEIVVIKFFFGTRNQACLQPMPPPSRYVKK